MRRMLEDSEADLEEKKRECDQLSKDLDYIQREHDKELADLRNQYDAEMARLMDEIDQLKVRVRLRLVLSALITCIK